ncbi:4Fe-4S dicluster domain-containing protein [Pseudokineococcus sp. 5B2Z-1]|uniref:4Fe-4S dicluster domain-containing protein n=2 Tax=Pseudokineococcus sp. 5B2Z-1 TaxID=3132744 RepID=UPI0030A3231D
MSASTDSRPTTGGHRTGFFDTPSPADGTGYDADHPPRMGFFTDTSVCIGCKACEVACKEWNMVPATGEMDLTGTSYDNSSMLGGSTWRHVAFVEQPVPQRAPVGLGMPGIGPGPAPAAAPGGGGGCGSGGGGCGSGGGASSGGLPPVADMGDFDVLSSLEGTATDPGSLPAPSAGAGEQGPSGSPEGVRWLMASDVCKHCTNAACLDVCPTGALFRTEFGTVVVQDDVCNGCGYCIPACPYGVIGKRESTGRAHKCTLCYDRLGEGMTPACAKACPTESIQFGPVDELRRRADERLAVLQEKGELKVQLYGHDTEDGVGGDGAFFLLLDDPEVYGLPPDPVVTTRDLPDMWKHAAMAAGTMLGALALSFLGARR